MQSWQTFTDAERKFIGEAFDLLDREWGRNEERTKLELSIMDKVRQATYGTPHCSEMLQMAQRHTEATI